MTAAPDNPQAPDRPRQPAPDVGRFGMKLFLAALAMLFGAGMLAYLLVRTQWLNPVRPPTPALGTLDLPAGLWISTVVIVASSLVLHAAGRAVRAGRLAATARMMIAAFVLAIGFVIVQGPCLWLLIDRHREMTERNVFLYALMALLIVVHAAHVIGGMIPMAVITVRAVRRRYSPEDHRPIAYLTLYWHFIDAIWLIMFAVFGLFG